MRPQEKSLYRSWLQDDITSRIYRSAEGSEIRILSPGRRNELEGPDFSDAVILIGEQILRGAVEIHCNNADWYHHGHHLDPVYNRTVLHVVSRLGDTLKIRRQDGNEIPTIVISSGAVAESRRFHPCESWSEVNTAEVFRVMDHYAGLRWQRKCREIRLEMQQLAPDQVFYQRLCDVLGYSRNRTAFQQLTARLPLEILYAVMESAPPGQRLIDLEALLFGSAGFLTGEQGKRLLVTSNYLSGLRKRWQRLQKKYTLSNDVNLPWHFMGSRPQNHPTRRLAALAQIIHRLYPIWPGEAFMGHFAAHEQFRNLSQWAIESFQQPSGLWRNHPLFHYQPGRILIGKSRLMDLWTNLLVPFAWAVGDLHDQPQLVERAGRMWHEIPRGEIPASVRQLLKRLSLSPRELRFNYRVQGCIEFSKRFCEMEICHICPLEEYAKL